MLPDSSYFGFFFELKLDFDLVLGLSWFALGTILGDFLEYFWVVLLHVRSRSDIDRFFIDFRTLEISKNIEKQIVF